MKFPDFRSLPEDPSLDNTARALSEQLAADAGRALAKVLDNSIRTFVNAIDGCEVPDTEIMQSGKFLKLATSAQDKPEEWENFFLWRGYVFAFRYLTGTHTNDNTHESIMDFSIQTVALAPEDVPEAVKIFIANNP